MTGVGDQVAWELVWVFQVGTLALFGYTLRGIRIEDENTQKTCSASNAYASASTNYFSLSLCKVGPTLLLSHAKLGNWKSIDWETLRRNFSSNSISSRRVRRLISN